MKRRVVFFHLLNDYSGSPHILAIIIKGIIDRGYIVDLYTSTVRSGFLSHIEGVKYHHVYYNFTNNRFRTLLLFLYAQIISFLAVFRYFFKRNIVIYVNTIYPFGAALGAVITRKRLIYHVHENPVRQNILSSFALFILNNFADKAIYVSSYLYNNSLVAEDRKVLVPNALSPEFTLRARQRLNFNAPHNILMICSLRKYKGVFVFCELASHLSQYKFTLVVNGTREEIDSFFKGTTLPENLKISSSQTDIHPFYCNADLLLNLSIPDLWVESFGLTVLEALTYGIPVIVPPVGGIAELVEEGVQGFKVDAGEKNLLILKINQVFSDNQKYSGMSENAKKKAELFSCTKLLDSIDQIISSK